MPSIRSKPKRSLAQRLARRRSPHSGTALRLTATIRTAFAQALRAEASSESPAPHLCTCPVCGDQLYVVRVTGMDGRRYYGSWRLQTDGFAWGADSRDEGSTENELVECTNVARCGVRRPLADFMVPDHDDLDELPESDSATSAPPATPPATPPA